MGAPERAAGPAGVAGRPTGRPEPAENTALASVAGSRCRPRAHPAGSGAAVRAGSDRVNYAEAVAAGRVGGASRRATGFAVTVLCLLLAVRISDVLRNGQPGQVPFTVA